MGPVRVGFDARPAFLDPLRGFGRVARSLCAALLEQRCDELVVFVPHGADVPREWYKLAVEVVQLRRPRRGAFIVDGPAWSVTLRRHPVEVLYLPAWGVPLGLSLPVVATFHDATPFHFPSPPSRWARHRLRAGIRSLHRATLVHAVSHHAAHELGRLLPAAAERIRVAHWGVGPPFTPGGEPPACTHLLFVGGADPHKNLGLLLRIMASPEASELPPLVVAGPAARDGVLHSRLAAAGLTGRVHLAPDVSDDALVELYRNALGTLVPSRNEGFGLPALEAMACGSAVLVADAGALPEVVGNAALLLPPENWEAWLGALLELRRDPHKREQLRRAGIGLAIEKTWECTARRLTAIFRSAAAPSGEGATEL